MVTAHLGNWAVMSQVFGRFGVPLTAVMHDGVAPAMRRALERMEAQQSFRVLYTDGSPSTAAAILAALQAGEAVGMMGDRVVAGAGALVPFLGGRADFPVGPYVLAATAEALVLHAFLLRKGRHRYVLEATLVEDVRWGARADRQAALAAWTGAFAAAVERHLRAHPDQWGNFHDVFATAAERAP
jgi:KDO2-lipid IV(A) lauroyltransferase